LLHDIDLSKVTNSFDLIKSLSSKKQVLNFQINSLSKIISANTGTISQLKSNIAKLESKQNQSLQLDKK
jgi:hypothetical protein